MSAPRTAVALCTGKDCRRRAEFEDLHDLLTGIPHVETRCLGLCNGPVVVVDPRAHHAIVLAKVRSPKQRRDLRRMIERGDRPTKRLAPRVVSGSKRRKALHRLSISLRRYH